VEGVLLMDMAVNKKPEIVMMMNMKTTMKTTIIVLETVAGMKTMMMINTMMMKDMVAIRCMNQTITTIATVENLIM
jgi:hypothetical protein